MLGNSTIKERYASCIIITVILNSHQEGPDKSTNQTVKMKFLVVFALVIVAVAAKPAKLPGGDVEILRSDFENLGLDSYNFAYVSEYS